MNCQRIENITFDNLLEAYVPEVHQLQIEWAFENITFGVITEKIEEIKASINPYCFVALDNQMVIGYLTAAIIEGNEYNVFPKGGKYIRVDDLYIQKEYRSLGIGSKLLELFEQKALQDGFIHFFVSSATKDAEAVRKFYIENGYSIWTTHFFKRVGKVNIEYPVGELDDIRFVSIYAKHKGKWVFCFHRKRQKWECPGGHVEKGEDPLTAAKRELMEETGAAHFTITPLWDYSFFTENHSNNGRVYFADVESLGDLPSSEMEKIGLFDGIPENVTYDKSNIRKKLDQVEKFMQAHG